MKLKLMNFFKENIKFNLNKFKTFINYSYMDLINYNNESLEVVYIVEKNNWSIYCDGFEITKEINKKLKKRFCSISSKPFKFKNIIMHFGSQYMWNDWYKHLSKDNSYIVNFYHGKYEDGTDVKKHIDLFLRSVPHIKYILTASTIVKNRLISWNVPSEKIVLIPIGVNTKIFRPASLKIKNRLRKKIGILEDEFVIGSFQKDGIGWKEGFKPKLIKGPDLFVEVLKILSKRIKIKVMLTGPARGFVKNQLRLNNISYSHVYLDSQENICDYYKVLDLYLITSREEGGPKGIVEGLSSGIPVASTNVGMARDIIRNYKNGILLNSFEPKLIAEQILKFIRLKKKPNIEEMRKSIYKADWKIVAENHFNKMYKPLRDLKS